LGVPTRAELGSAVEADFTDETRSRQQFLKKSDLLRSLKSELRMKT